MPLTPQQILERLVEIVPGFHTYWESPEACFHEDNGEFTCCGVFGDCSHFVRAQYEQLSTVQRRQLAAFVVECMSSSDKELGNAAATCFLENLTHERFSKDFENYLAGDALDFYRRFQGT
ncbi:DUF7674 family protein [Humisphaera borealis]